MHTYIYQRYDKTWKKLNCIEFHQKLPPLLIWMYWSTWPKRRLQKWCRHFRKSQPSNIQTIMEWGWVSPINSDSRTRPASGKHLTMTRLLLRIGTNLFLWWPLWERFGSIWWLPNDYHWRRIHLSIIWPVFYPSRKWLFFKNITDWFCAPVLENSWMRGVSNAQLWMRICLRIGLRSNLKFPYWWNPSWGGRGG